MKNKYKNTENNLLYFLGVLLILTLVFLIGKPSLYKGSFRGSSSRAQLVHFPVSANGQPDIYINKYQVTPIRKGEYRGVLVDTRKTSSTGESARLAVRSREMVNFLAFRTLAEAQRATRWTFGSPPYKNFTEIDNIYDRLCQINYLRTNEKLRLRANGEEGCATSLSIAVQPSEAASARAARDYGISGFMKFFPAIMEAAEELNAPKEECLGFNPNNLRVEDLILTDGSSSMKSFPNIREANTAMRIIKHYGLNQHCFVGRGKTKKPMEFWLTKEGTPPSGIQRPYPREDCTSFMSNSIIFKEIDDTGVYDVVSQGTGGSNLILMQGENESLAKAYVTAIRKYNFSNICYVGRPGASMIYFKTK